ncbi:MAG TPA: c-type cytochrome [Gaiellaceae bacterium]|nr:c-type cytochrome [Gaiellaceae bacterium]
MPLALTGYEIGLLAVACVFIVFALIAALIVPRARPDFPAKRLGVFIAVCIALFASQMTAVLVLAEVGEADEPHGEATPTETTETTGTETNGSGTETTQTETTETETTETTEGGGDPAAGKDVFATAGCVSCHTLADAGASGTIGPNLDQARPPAELVVERVTNGQGVMPPFKDSLSEQQIQDVAAYVSSAAGG